MKELVEGAGGPFGSMYVDQMFFLYLEEKLTPEAVQRFRTEEPIEYLEMMAEWERIKCNYDSETSGSVVYFPLRTKLYKLLLKEYSDVLDRLSEAQAGEDEHIQIADQQMRSFFAPVLTGLTDVVEEAFARLGTGRRCDSLFLVDGWEPDGAATLYF